MPLRNGKNGNDIELFFNRFVTVLFALNNNIPLLKWVKYNENPITKAVDITYDEHIIREYSSGIKVKNNRKRIIGFTWILTSKLENEISYETI